MIFSKIYMGQKNNLKDPEQERMEVGMFGRMTALLCKQKSVSCTLTFSGKCAKVVMCNLSKKVFVRFNKFMYFLRKLKFPNFFLVVFSLIFLYINVVYETLHGHLNASMDVYTSVYGILYCIGPVAAWWLRWSDLNRDYRHIALFLSVVFLVFLILHIINLLVLFF